MNVRTFSTRREGTGSAVRTRGFTLIELLVALAVFASMAALAYGGLNGVVRARQVLQEEAEALGRLQFAVGLIERDLRSAIERPVRDAYGGEKPAWTGTRTAIEFTRLGAGAGSLGGAPLLERVAYQLRDDRLERITWSALDRAPGTRPQQRLLLEAGRVEFRFLDAGGRWHGQWPPPTDSDVGTPRAVEFRIDHDSLGELRRIVAPPQRAGT